MAHLRKLFGAVLAFVILYSAAIVFADTSDVKLTKLDNGLTVITKEIHTAPVVNLSVWYRVGSRNETTGITGISHALEHMAFKGTKKYPEAGVTDRMIREIGGTGNAGTNVDYTVYYETVPAGKQDVAIDIESDRMNGMMLRQEDFASEKYVIEEERKMRNEDSAIGLFWEEINAAAFKVHPYGWPIIGWMSDIDSLDASKIRKYYESHYAPNNAVVVVAGDFRTDEVLEKIKATFGKVPHGGEPPVMNAVEPEQKVEKRIVYKSDKTNLAYVVYAYHAPSIAGADSPALEVAAAVLSSGRESRLYKSFIETGLASSADAVHDTNQDPYLFYFEIEAQPGQDTAVIEKKLDEEVEKLKTGFISDYELQKAKNRFAASEIFSNESISMYGRKLGWYHITAGDYSHLDKYLEAINKVTSANVQQVAKKYFIPENRTVGILLPKERDVEDASSAAPAGKRPGHKEYGYFTGANATSAPNATTGANKDVISEQGGSSATATLRFSEHVKSRILPNGLMLIVYENPAFPVVHVKGIIKGAGSFGDTPELRGLAQLTSRTLRWGTKTRTYDDINKALEFVGADMNISCGNEQVVFSGRYLKKDFAMGFELLADVLINPVFPADGVEVERGVAVSDVAYLEKNNRNQAWQAFADTVYANHPYSNPVSGTTDGLKAIKIEDLIRYHDATYRPDRTIIVLAGSITESEAVEAAGKYFNSWKAPDARSFEAPPVPTLDGIKTKYVTMPEKAQDVFYLGFPALKPDDPDYYTFQIMTDVLAGTDLTSRLYNVIREKEGLVYYVYGQHLPRTSGATFQITGGLAPENLDRAIELIRSEIKRIQNEPLTEKELSEAKSFAIGQLPLDLETNENVAAVLADLAYFGRPFDSIDKYPAEIQKITADAIMRVAREQLKADGYALGVAGPSVAPTEGSGGK